MLSIARVRYDEAIQAYDESIQLGSKFALVYGID
jgi:hypothetical protein